jgi:hypothetical protein
MASKIFGAKSGAFCDPGKRRRTDLFSVVEAKRKIRPAVALELSM